KAEAEDDGQPAQPRRIAGVQLARAGMVDRPHFLGHTLDDGRGHEGSHAAGCEKEKERKGVLVHEQRKDSSVAAGFSRPAEAGRYIAATTTSVTSSPKLPEVKAVSSSMIARCNAAAEAPRCAAMNAASRSSPSSPWPRRASDAPSVNRTRRSPGASAMVASWCGSSRKSRQNVGPPVVRRSIAPPARARIGGLCPAFV